MAAMKEHENIYFEGRIKVPYMWHVGETGSRFLIALRDNREIWGVRCPKCKKVFVPPVKTCGECFVPTDKWVRVKDTGRIESFTVVRYAHGMQPKKPPLVYGLVKLDGADGALLHFIGGAGKTKLKIGMKVKAVFAKKRTGSITDISHFAPVKK